MTVPTDEQISRGTISDSEFQKEEKMPVHREARNGKFVVVDNEGRVYGRHETKDEANAQMAAVNNALRKRDKGKGFLPSQKTPRKTPQKTPPKAKAGAKT